MGQNFCGSLFLWIFDFFVFFGKLIFAIRTERFFLAGYICIHVCSLQRAAMKWIGNIKDMHYFNKSCLANLRLELQCNKFEGKVRAFFPICGNISFCGKQKRNVKTRKIRTRYVRE